MVPEVVPALGGETYDVALEAARTNPAAPLVISGRAQTIAVVRRALKHAGLNGRPTTVKAYWDENRAGLD